MGIVSGPGSTVGGGSYWDSFEPGRMHVINAGPGPQQQQEQQRPEIPEMPEMPEMPEIKAPSVTVVNPPSPSPIMAQPSNACIGYAPFNPAQSRRWE